MKILHVEDYADMLKATSRLLRAYGFDDFRQVSDLESATSAITQYQPDAIILDGSFPLEAGGLKDNKAWEILLRYLEKTNRKIPVILNSSEDLERELEGLGSLPFQVYLMGKAQQDSDPIKIVEKLKEIQQALHR